MIIPSGRTIAAAFSSIRSWSSANSAISSGFFRQRASGRWAKMPRPVQGASTRTRSACRFGPRASFRAVRSVASASTVRMEPSPWRSAFSVTRARRVELRSTATTSPMSSIETAMCVDLPPGAAPSSMILSPGRGSRTLTTSIEASSWA